MHVHGGVLAAVCIGLALLSPHLAPAQEAASATLPDQFQTGEMALPGKSKKKKTKRISKTFATAPRQNVAPASKQTPAMEQPPARVLPEEEKNAESSARNASIPPSQKRTPMTEQPARPEDSETATVSVQKKPRPKRRAHPPAHREEVSIPAPVPMSLSVAQSMAIRAPLPEYPYEAKRRDLTGSGLCVLTVDPQTGKVTNVTMEQSTGSRVLDKVTTETFKRWRFKPGTVSQVRLPISYE